MQSQRQLTEPDSTSLRMAAYKALSREERDQIDGIARTVAASPQFRTRGIALAKMLGLFRGFVEMEEATRPAIRAIKRMVPSRGCACGVARDRARKMRRHIRRVKAARLA